MITGRITLGCVALAMWVCILTIGQAADNTGERVYNSNCQRCHGPSGEGAKAPSLVPFKWSYERALELIREPECDMPPFPKSELSDEDVGEIVTYLKSIK
jgi:mono/diheme cytochrome c family protein